MKKINILIVDDEAGYRETYPFGLQLLEKYGFEIICFKADSLQVALEILLSETINLVMTDGIFPEKSGGRAIAGHGHFKPEEFRGNQVVAKAKGLGIKTVGISSEPKYFVGADKIFAKPIDFSKFIPWLAGFLNK